jgi:lipoate-protein ligase A
MLIFFRPFTDPYFNIAAEEYFVKHATEDICMIWINEQSVIIGKHQNAFAEINYPFIHKNKIPVIRRISGGGAVYHDTGNVNFTFIKKTDKANQVDFGKFTSIIVKFIQSFGLEVNVSKRNSLFIGNLKFSGHAEHIFHDRVLHHGTILYNTDLQLLQLSLNPEKEYQGKAMQSVRNEVTNIAPLLSQSIEIHQFVDKLVAWLKEYYAGSSAYEIQHDELEAIEYLSESKYKTWQWNFGYSPKYDFKVNIPLKAGSVPIVITVENGRFANIDILKEVVDRERPLVLNSMIGLLHKEEEIKLFIEKNNYLLELAGVNTVNLSEVFFK